MNRQSGLLDESALSDLLREMAEADARATTPSRVEESLMQAWETHRQSLPPRRRSRGVVWGILAVAASLIVAVALQERGGSVANRAVPISEEESSWSAGPEGNTPYESIAWLDADRTTLQVVRLRVPSATFAEQGYSVSDVDGDGSVEIDVIIGADGEARSIRVSPGGPATIR